MSPRECQHESRSCEPNCPGQRQVDAFMHCQRLRLDFMGNPRARLHLAPTGLPPPGGSVRLRRIAASLRPTVLDRRDRGFARDLAGQVVQLGHFVGCGQRGIALGNRWSVPTAPLVAVSADIPPIRRCCDQKQKGPPMPTTIGDPQKEPMREDEWLIWSDPWEMVAFLRGAIDDRKLRSFGLAWVQSLPEYVDALYGFTVQDYNLYLQRNTRHQFTASEMCAGNKPRSGFTHGACGPAPDGFCRTSRSAHSFWKSARSRSGSRSGSFLTEFELL